MPPQSRLSPAVTQWLWGTAFATVLLLLALTHIPQAALSFWWDELYTLVNYVEPGVFDAWTADYHTNNHVLFSMLSAASGAILGPGEVSYRLPSLGFVLAAYAGLMVQVNRHIGRVEALSTGLILLFSPLLLYWVTQARGYGLTTFAAVLVLGGTLVLTSKRESVNRLAWAQVLLGGFVGIATLPHFALLFTLSCLALAAVLRDRWRAVAGAWALVGTAALLFYLPSGPVRIMRASGVDLGPPLSPGDTFTGPFRFQIVGTLKGAGDLGELLSDRWIPVAVSVLVVFALLALARAYIERDWAPLVLTLIPIYGSYLVFFALRLAVTDRSLLFLFPHLAVLLAFGIGYLMRAHGRQAAIRWLVLAPLMAAAVVMVLLTLKMAFAWAAIPIEDYRGATAVATNSDVNVAVTDSSRSLGFSYYLPDIVVLDEASLFGFICDGTESAVYIAHSYKRPFDPPVDCLEDRAALRVDLRQRRRGTMSVWLVPEVSPGN
ncbi:MAG: hypothetical protein PVG83_08660 [Acidimicrobiia bacterium]